MNWAGATFSEAIWHREFDLSEKIARAVRRNVIQGKSLQKCAKELEEHLDSDRKHAVMRLIRTETTHVHVEMRGRAFKDTGVEKYRFNANLDGRTSAICASLHGQVFPLDEAEVGKNKPPMHPNCRSDIVAHYDRPLIEDKVYRMKMPDGKYVEIPLGQEKEEWAKIYAPDWVGTGGRKGYNKGTVSGAISGALNPDSDEAEAHAERYYGLVRSMKTDVKRIAQNTGLKEDDIQRIKNYLFLDKHDLGEVGLERFAPDFYIAESWRRLISGKDIQPHDITLLHHEIMEKELFDDGLTQSEAHRITSEKYNYQKESEAYYVALEKRKKRRK